MIGKTISHYKILEKLGEGGMGVVYKAEDTKLKRTVALKFLPPELTRDPEVKERFVHEAQAASALDHPNICTIHEIDETDDGQTFIVMACYEGEILKDKIQRGSLKVEEAIDIAIQVAQGLEKAHNKDIIHRDIKPANIFVTNDNIVKILDFGLAKLVGQVGLTKTGTTLGTIAYMSPEQARGEEVDHRTDIWSLGVVTYEMVTGQLPFKGEYEQAVVYSIMNENPEPITGLRTGVPMELERVVDKAMTKSPGERYQYVDEMRIDLRSIKKEIESGILKERLTKARLPRRKRAYLYSGVTALLVLLIGIGFHFWRSAEQESTHDSIAVLPLENLSGDPDQDYFADGMTEALITDLAKIRALRVISRTSVMQYKGARKPLPEIARDLNVDAVVEGSVLRSGERVRITAQLIEAATDRHLWAESYERDLHDILALQREVARAIAQEIQVKLTPQEQAHLSSARPVNPEAYRLCLKGRYYWNKRTDEGFRRGIQYFEQAIEKDPAYALAYAGLADSYALLANYELLPPKEAYPRAKAAAMKALEIDDTLAEAHTSLAFVGHHYDWDWLAVEREFKRAIELNPGYATAHQWYAEYLTTMRRHDRAAAEIKRAQELDPLSLVIHLNVGRLLFYAHRYDLAIEELQNTLELDPNYFWAHVFIGMAYEQKAMYADAMAEAQKAMALSGGGPSVSLAHTYAVSGRRGEAIQILDQLKVGSGERYFIAGIYAGLGAKDEAFAWLEKAYEERSHFMVFLQVDPWFDSLRSDPRFTALLKRIGLEK